MKNRTALWYGDQKAARQQQATIQQAAAMIGRYKSEPWILPPEEQRKQLNDLLTEIDPYDVYAALDLQTWDIIGGRDGSSGDERQRAVTASKWLYKYNPLAQWAIWLWTAWGMGDKVRVSVPDNEKASESVNEFFTAERNGPVLADDKIKELSRWLLAKGNRFFVFFTSTTDGQSTIRLIDQDEMTPICNPDDSKEVWFYKREWTQSGASSGSRTRYYPDWKTYFADRD